MLGDEQDAAGSGETGLHHKGHVDEKADAANRGGRHDQGCRHQVGDGAEQRDAAETRQQDRKNGDLSPHSGNEDRSRPPACAWACDVRPSEHACGGGDGELEPDIGGELSRDQEQCHDGTPERPPRADREPDYATGENEARHCRRTHDGRLPACCDHEHNERNQPACCTHSRTESDGARNEPPSTEEEGDVGARNGDEVGESRPAEVLEVYLREIRRVANEESSQKRRLGAVSLRLEAIEHEPSQPVAGTEQGTRRACNSGDGGTDDRCPVGIAAQPPRTVAEIPRDPDDLPRCQTSRHRDGAHDQPEAARWPGLGVLSNGRDNETFAKRGRQRVDDHAGRDLDGAGPWERGAEGCLDPRPGGGTGQHPCDENGSRSGHARARPERYQSSDRTRWCRDPQPGKPEQAPRPGSTACDDDRSGVTRQPTAHQGIATASRNAASLASPIPATSSRSSTALKGPCCSR